MQEEPAYRPGRAAYRRAKHRRASWKATAKTHEWALNRGKEVCVKTYVVGSIGMVVNSAKEGCRAILTDHLCNEMTATRMLIDERRNVVDETSDDDQRTLQRLFLDCAQTINNALPDQEHQETLTAIPADNRQVVAVGSPVQSFLLLAKALELHGKLALGNLVLGENLQMAGETELGADPDEPLRRVVLVPLDRVTVVHRELVVEVVVTLANGDECRDHMVARCVLVIEGGLTEPVRERVDAKGGLEPR